MQFSKLVLLSPIGAFKPEILTSKVKIAFFLGHLILMSSQQKIKQKRKFNCRQADRKKFNCYVMSFIIDKQMLHRLLNEVCCKSGKSGVYDKRNEEHECREAGDCDNGQREGGVELQLGLHWDDIIRKYTFLMP